MSDWTYDPYARLGEVPTFALESDDIADGAPLSARHYGEGSGGEDVSPHLRWSGAPAETKSFAVTVFDPDAPTGSGFWHWAVYNLPADTTELPTGAGAAGFGLLPAGAQTLPNEMRLRQFVGAAPPDREHRYFFVVHALDVESLDLDPESTPAILGFNAHFHTLARAQIVATATPDGAKD
ncbi:YbhB/YbcL family Raf kinase inhibitor-like protein [Rathayibacter sp. AY1H3]|uniref:YbhB/YbcL family Raf kinase inhibitor-like protein n=1 Tax=Rathayibacter sp. AY1H3 TaxID=2080567 RepID=UPI000CE7F5A0|nr:YbhB/YbcL family Raf kinase inhibitor-like protein [Rathayibacter sp. AY1H3]PPH09259.1 YbhB/YbcL family Raf kinase inhibitor-like protein [Rathayibacter sp. AY1H3]